MRSQSPDRLAETRVHISIILDGTINDGNKWMIPRNVPLRRLLEAFCERNELDAARVTFSQFDGWHLRPRAHPTTINVDQTPEELSMESSAIFDAVVVPDTHLVFYVLHPFFNENKRTIRIKTRLDSTVKSMMDTSFTAFELPSFYRTYMEFEFEGVLFEPVRHGEKR